jgi:ADP-ribose pyrophosphatase
MSGDDLADAPVDAALTGPERRGGGFYGYDRYRITVDGQSFERDVVRVGRVVVLLPIDIERDEVVLIRQFRLGAHLAFGKGDLVEVPAGRVEGNEDLQEAARRELEEETGVVAWKLVPIFEVMPSAGASDEYMYFFLAAVDASKVLQRAGAADEHEYIRPQRVPIDAALNALDGGKLHYGAAVLALQWLAINRQKLREIAGR